MLYALTMTKRLSTPMPRMTKGRAPTSGDSCRPNQPIEVLVLKDQQQGLLSKEFSAGILK